MNRRFSTILALLLAFALVASMVAGCQSTEEGGGGDGESEAPASDLKAAMVTDVGGLGDKSFNDLSYEGLKRAEEELGVEIEALSSKEIADYDSNLSQLANAGYNPIFCVGFLMTDAMNKAAQDFPDTNFGGIDIFLEEPASNAAGLVFKEQEAGYLAGVVAGLATKDKFDERLNADNVIGFVGGMEIPAVVKFQAGFIAGAKSVNPDVKVVSLYAGKFDDQAKGKELGLSLIDQKCDIVFAAAGQTGLGTIKACQERNALFIGVDADQYETVPGTGDVMLTSAIKKVDVAVFETIKAMVDDEFPGGTNKTFGLTEDAVGLAPFHDFESKVPQAIKDAVDKASTDIKGGTVTVPETVQ